MEDDDVPTLSAETFAALQEFYTEQEKRQEIYEKLEADDKLKENILFDENWQLSQFWYDEKTVQTLVKVIDQTVPDGGKVALISCPTLFVPLRRQISERATVTLLEYDRRFEVHAPDFIFYDYNFPDKLPLEVLNSYDLVVADPPFLSEECITKTSETIKLMAKEKIVVCTGATMKEQVERLLGLKQCSFQPQHRNNLANEFSCYANFDLDEALSVGVTQYAPLRCISTEGEACGFTVTRCVKRWDFNQCDWSIPKHLSAHWKFTLKVL